jgi:hypothetical protein
MQPHSEDKPSVVTNRPEQRAPIGTCHPEKELPVGENPPEDKSIGTHCPGTAHICTDPHEGKCIVAYSPE